jgi:hypothetical protein
MADSLGETSAAFQARWEALFTQQQQHWQEYDAANPTLLDTLEGLQERMDDLSHSTEDQQQARDQDRQQGMAYG